MVKSVRDAAVGLSVLAGEPGCPFCKANPKHFVSLTGIDPLDDRTFENPIKTYPFDYTEGLEEFSLNGTRIGLLPDSLWNESNIAVKAKDAKQNLIETVSANPSEILKWIELKGRGVGFIAYQSRRGHCYGCPL